MIRIFIRMLLIYIRIIRMSFVDWDRIKAYGKTNSFQRSCQKEIKNWHG